MKQQAYIILVGFGLFLIGCNQQGGTHQQTANLSVDSFTETDYKHKNSHKEEEKIEEKVTFDDFKAQEILTAYFERFSREEFNALQNYYTPNVKQYITLKNIKAEEVSRISRDFFLDKTNIHYFPDFSRFHLISQANYFVTTLPIEMHWALNSSQVEEGRMRYDKRVAQVMLEITFDQDYKMVSYVEKKVIKPEYRLLQDITVQLADNENITLELSEGTVVIDHFERRFKMGFGGQLKVLYQGKAYWIQEYKEGFGRAGISLLERIQ